MYGPYTKINFIPTVNFYIKEEKHSFGVDVFLFILLMYPTFHFMSLLMAP